jgi:hypothetical protein
MENTVHQQNPNYNELVSQIQKASMNGATSLPSRDIPIDPTLVNTDVQVKPSYIPPPPVQEDYIRNYETPDNLIMQNNIQQENMDNLEALYNEFQLPLIIALLYFLFQLPSVKKYSKQLLPSLFNSDGNPNFYGYVLNSVLFASMVYILLKVINKLHQNI